MQVAKPFSLLANVYDEIMLDIKYEQWTDFILKILNKLGWQGKKVLDLGCGTGNSTFPLFARGYEVIGLDGSADMLRVAREKLPQIRFLQANFESFELTERFDLVISVFDSLNNLLSPKAFLKTARQVYKHLNIKGVFIFDFNTSLGLRNIWDRGQAEGWVNNVHYHWKYSFDENTKLVRVEAYCEDDQQEFTEVHYERAYEPSEVKELLDKAGFGNVLTVSFPSGRQAGKDDMRVWGVGVKTHTNLPIVKYYY